MSIINTIPTYEPSGQLAPVGKKDLDRSDFMTLFITQLKYQDPLKPMDSYEIASQLAQFSNMEATMQMSDNMEKLLEYQTSQNNLQLLTLIDKDVQAYGNGIAVNEGEVKTTEFSLSNAVEICVVDIYDAAGRLVNSIDAGYKASGPHNLTWDGTNFNGDQVEDGFYYYKVEALDATGQEAEVEYRTSGHVTSVEFKNGKAILTIDKYIETGVNDIISVM